MFQTMTKISRNFAYRICFYMCASASSSAIHIFDLFMRKCIWKHNRLTFNVCVCVSNCFYFFAKDSTLDLYLTLSLSPQMCVCVLWIDMRSVMLVESVYFSASFPIHFTIVHTFVLFLSFAAYGMRLNFN